MYKISQGNKEKRWQEINITELCETYEQITGKKKDKN